MEDIKKGIVNDFTQNSDTMKFAKKGSEIKGAVESVLANINSEKVSIVSSMEKLLEDIHCAPDSDNNSWRTEDYKHLLGIIPKSFSYDKIYGNDRIKESSYNSQSVVTPDKETQNKMRDYNNLVDKFITISLSALNLQSLARNLEDKKNYMLTIDQLTKLGL